jgi:hypothetical protein
MTGPKPVAHFTKGDTYIPVILRDDGKEPKEDAVARIAKANELDPGSVKDGPPPGWGDDPAPGNPSAQTESAETPKATVKVVPPQSQPSALAKAAERMASSDKPAPQIMGGPKKSWKQKARSITDGMTK